jgi:hypothetical protein
MILSDLPPCMPENVIESNSTMQAHTIPSITYFASIIENRTPISIPQSFLLVLSQPLGLLCIEWRMNISVSPSQVSVDSIIDLLRILLVRYKIIKGNSGVIQ